MASLRTNLRLSDVASAAAWAALGAALVIHGCAPAPARQESPTARRSPPPAPRQVAQAPAPAPAPAAAPVPAPEPPKPVFEERPAVPAGEPEVRIRVAALRAARPAVKLTNASGSLVMQAEGIAPRTVRAPVTVRQSAGGWSITEAGAKKGAAPLEVAAAGPIEFHPPAGKAGTVTFDGTDWPGPVRIVPVDDAPGALDLVVDVALERYLPGVLAKELIRGWDEDAFRAQAIAARSFAICEHAHWAAVRHYDMVAGEASQAWVGTTKDRRPQEAVKATRGMVLAFEGRVVPAYYSSTCGGTPANAAASLTRNPNHDIAPLAAGARTQARRDCCADAPRYQWKQSLSVAGACAQLRRWAADQVEARDGRTVRPTAEPAVGSAVPAAVAEATVAAAPAVPPAAPSAAPASRTPAAVRAAPAPAVAEIATDAPLDALTGIQAIRSLQVIAANAAGRPERVRIDPGDGRPLEMRAEDFRRAVNYAPEGEPAPKERLFSSHLLSARVAGGKLELEGRGFGHGVGMCQYGAQSMAKGGADAAAILRTYYPGATVVRAYR
jgi:stage II sporulation protein D